MIEALHRTRQSFVRHQPCSALEGAQPRLHHTVSVSHTAGLVEVSYHLLLQEAGRLLLESGGDYEVVFAPGHHPDADQAQAATWPYFRQDTLVQLAQAGLDAEGVLPVLNPVQVGPTGPFNSATPSAAAPNLPVPATETALKWKGVFPHRFEVARGLMRTLDEIARHGRHWQYSVLRTYT